MMVQSRCELCKTVFTLNEKQRVFLEKMRDKGQAFIMLECQRCGLATHYVDPSLDAHIPPESPPALRCPISHCSGWVSHVEEDDENFWGCGECGSIWSEKISLDKEIAAIIKKFKYREKSYRGTDSGYTSVNIDQEEKNYEGLVEREPEEERDSFKRG